MRINESDVVLLRVGIHSVKSGLSIETRLMLMELIVLELFLMFLGF